jgi:hypothetical protein
VEASWSSPLAPTYTIASDCMAQAVGASLSSAQQAAAQARGIVGVWGLVEHCCTWPPPAFDEQSALPDMCDWRSHRGECGWTYGAGLSDGKCVDASSRWGPGVDESARGISAVACVGLSRSDGVSGSVEPHAAKIEDVTKNVHL